MNGNSFFPFITSLYGVRTLEEFHQTITSFFQNQNTGLFTVLLCGPLPMGVKLDCHFVENVIIYDSDMAPSVDIDYLMQAFHMGVSSVISLLQ